MEVDVYKSSLYSTPPPPGQFTGSYYEGTPAGWGPEGRFLFQTRNYSPNDANARFLLEELLPEATRGLNITTDPAGRAICGNSSNEPSRNPRSSTGARRSG